MLLGTCLFVRIVRGTQDRGAMNTIILNNKHGNNYSLQDTNHTH